MNWVLATEGDKLFQCGIVRGGGLQGITVCLVYMVLSTMWWPGCFQTVSRGHILVFFNRHCSTMNLVKEKQGGLVPPGLKRWPFKLVWYNVQQLYTVLLLCMVLRLDKIKQQFYKNRTFPYSIHNVCAIKVRPSKYMPKTRFKDCTLVLTKYSNFWKTPTISDFLLYLFAPLC